MQFLTEAKGESLCSLEVTTGYSCQAKCEQNGPDKYEVSYTIVE
jgi:hypothetical protein